MFSDDEIIASVLAGRKQDFSALIERHGRKVVLFVQRMTGDPDEAQALGQETFVKVYENLRWYRPENNFPAFLFRIARNLTLNWLKKQRRVHLFSRLFRDGEEGDRFASGDAPPDHAEEAERRDMVEAALRRLPPDQRLALVLKVYVEMSYAQIAAVTGWSEPKIETLISRGRSRLVRDVRLQETEFRGVSPSEAHHDLPNDR